MIFFKHPFCSVIYCLCKIRVFLFFSCLIKNDNRWGLTNLDILSNKLVDKNSFELRNYYNKQKTDIEEKIKNIELLEFIYSRLNYLDLNLNRTLFNNIKNEIKNIIKYNMLF